MKLTLWLVRLVFVVLLALAAWVTGEAIDPEHGNFIAGVIGLIVGLLLVVADILIQRKSLIALVAATMGIVLGALLERLVFYVLDLTGALKVFDKEVIPGLELIVMVLLCYLFVTIILQTRDDFRMVIPYVRFSKEATGPRPLVLDSSVIIDGRIADIVETHIFEAPLVVPRFVLDEIQAIADSADSIKRNRGRRGLDMLNRLRKSENVSVEVRDALMDSVDPVDTRLVKLAAMVNGRVVTNDFNLNKIAQLQGVEVININDLTKAVRPVVLPGEEIAVKIIKHGQEAGQGVGYLEDGTMVVVENGRQLVDQNVRICVTSVLQTSAGRMIFGKPRQQNAS